MATYPPSGFLIDAILCDSAATADGKLWIQGGGWNNLWSQTFPFRQARIAVGLVMSVPYIATNANHTFTLHLEDQDGERKPVGPNQKDKDGLIKTPMSIEAQFNIGRPPILQAGDAQTIPLAFNLDQLTFTSPGSYSFVLSIDGEEVERLTFRVLGVPGSIAPSAG